MFKSCTKLSRSAVRSHTAHSSINKKNAFFIQFKRELLDVINDHLYPIKPSCCVFFKSPKVYSATLDDLLLDDVKKALNMIDLVEAMINFFQKCNRDTSSLPYVDNFLCRSFPSLDLTETMDFITRKEKIIYFLMAIQSKLTRERHSDLRRLNPQISIPSSEEKSSTNDNIDQECLTKQGRESIYIMNCDIDALESMFL